MKSAHYRYGRMLALMLLAACGAEAAPADPSAFTEMNLTKIEYDCGQFLQCIEVTNDTMTTPKQFDTCVKDKSASLKDNATGQWQFLADFDRCGTAVACSYMECADLHTQSYGITQLGKLPYRCQQELLCVGYTGDMQTAQRLCETDYFLTIDSYTPDQRAVFEGKFNLCSTLVGCEFKTCFVP